MSGAPAQAWLLGRAYFSRLLESDLMPQGLPQAQLLIWSISALAAPALAVPMMIAHKYWHMTGQELLAGIAFDRLLLITLSLAVMGLVALATWDGVLPDRRDVRTLSPLPIATPTFVVARLGAMGALFALYLAGSGVLPTLLQAAMAAGFPESTPFLRTLTAQLTAVFAAGAFGFFSLVLLQCGLFAVFGRRVVQRVSTALQMLFTLALLLLVLLVPWFSGLTALGGRNAPPPVALAWLLPPVWFYALFDRLGGFTGATPPPLANVALASVLLTLVGSAVLYAASYRRMVAQALETPPPPRRRVRWLSRVEFLPSALRGTPIERAVCGFALRTLARSRQHRLLLTIPIAMGAGVVLLVLFADSRHAYAALYRPGPALGHVVFVMYFFTLGAMRLLFGIPLEPRANWAVRVREPEDRVAVVLGARRALVMGGVLPLTLLSLVITTLAWGALPAVRHAVFSFGMGFLLADVLTLNFRKIPFTCTYRPGSSGLRTRWPALIFALSWYGYGVPVFEFSALRTPGRFAIALVAIACASMAISALRAYGLRQEPGLDFAEPDPEALFEGFHLSEGLAGNARP